MEISIIYGLIIGPLVSALFYFKDKLQNGRESEKPQSYCTEIYCVIDQFN